MAVTKLQQQVLDNLDRVVSDGARCDTTYTLDGSNISLQVRGLLRGKMLVFDDEGRLKRSSFDAPRQQVASMAIVQSLRALLLDEPDSSIDLSRLQ